MTGAPGEDAGKGGELSVDELRERYLYLLQFARRIERYSHYRDGAGYYREGDVANGAFTRQAVLTMRAKLRDWFPEDRP